MASRILCSHCAADVTGKPFHLLVERGSFNHYMRLCSKCNKGEPRMALEAAGYVHYEHKATQAPTT